MGQEDVPDRRTCQKENMLRQAEGLALLVFLAEMVLKVNSRLSFGAHGEGGSLAVSRLGHALKDDSLCLGAGRFAF